MTMAIAHSQPAITWTIVGAGAAMLGPVENLDDGVPGTLTAFNWLSGTQNTATVFKLRGAWASGAIRPGLVGFSNIRLPVGTKVSVRFRRSSDPANTYPVTLSSMNIGDIQRIFEGPRGERTCLFLLVPHVVDIVGVEFSIFNDVNGVSSIAASAPFWIGDVLVRVVTFTEIEAEWTPAPTDTTTANYSPDRQPYLDPGLVYHQLTFRLPADTGANYFGDPNDANAIDYEKLMAKLDRGQDAVYIPRYVDDDGEFSAHMLHRTAKLGLMTKLPSTTHRNGPYFDSSPATVTEIPIPT